MAILSALLHTTCNACGTAYPVRSYVDKVTCPSCQHEGTSLSWSWVTTAPLGKPQQKQATDKGAPNLLGELAPCAVTCQSCKAEIAEAQVASAVLAITPPAMGKLQCPHCQAALVVRRAPPTVTPESSSAGAGRYWNAIIGEDPGLVLGTEHAEAAPRPGAIAFACTQCGAQLSVDGSTRTPTCQYCNTRVFLPDALWSALHPVPKVIPFYFWLDPNKMRARKAVARADSLVAFYAIVALLWLVAGIPILGGVLVDGAHWSWGAVIGLGVFIEIVLLVLCIRSINRGSVSS